MQKETRIIFIGDISGRPGRESIANVLPKIKSKYKPHLVVANCENAAGGIGVTRETLLELHTLGIDFFTSGDHVFRFKDFVDDLADSTLPLIVPANFAASDVPGKKYEILSVNGKQIGLLNLLGNDFMQNSNVVSNPFWFLKGFFSTTLPSTGKLPADSADFWLLDFHAETTAEKLSLAWYSRQWIKAFVGTHTHVPTADARIMDGSAYVTDVGQVGPLNASLWVDFESTIHNFMFPDRKPFSIEMSLPRIFNAVLIKFQNNSPKSIERVDVVIE